MIKFASNLEERIYEYLDNRNVDVKYEPETFKYHRRTRETYCKRCGSKNTYRLSRYTPDFRIGTSIYIETKGYLTSSNRTKMEDFLSSNPDFDLRFLFGADNWLTRKRVKKYSDWAKSLKVPYAIHDIPDSWIRQARRQLASVPDSGGR